MFILSILHYGYDKFIGLLMEDKKDKKYTDKDVIIKMEIYGIILFLSILIMYYIPYIAYVLISMRK